MNKQVSKTSTFNIIVFFMKRHIKIYSLLAMLGLVIGLLEGLNLVVFLPMLNNLVGASPPAHNAESGVLLGFVNTILHYIPIKDGFLAAGSLFLFLTILKGVLSLLHEYMAAHASGAILKQYRQELINRYKNASLSFFDTERAGGLLYNLNMPPIMLSKLLYMMPRAFIDFLRFFFVMVVLFYTSPVITLSMIAFGATLYLVGSRPLTKVSYKLSLARRSAEQEMSAVATEWLRGIRPIRTAGADKHWVGIFSEKNEISRYSYVKTSFLLASPRHVFELIAFSALFIGMMVAYWRAPDAFATQVATIGFFAMGLARVLPSFATLARTPIDIRTMLPDVENLYSIFKTLPEKEMDGVVVFNGLQSKITLKNVSVEHVGRVKALDNISLSIPKGKVVAFVGSSGAGKTTMLNTLIGAQSLSTGQVDYDANTLEELNKASLLSQVGYVGQDVLLFHGTVRENIAYFKKDISLDAIKSAANMAQISDFIESLPDGYDSVVGEGGVNFSGGQAQRLAIARAVVNNPDILILDEATSALDSTSEKMVVEAIQHVSQNRTVIIVTHRLATVKWANIIYVLNKGRLEEFGSWVDLTKNKLSYFYKMCREQGIL
tara:strand:+ start:10342 stop:12156 length:1815 start_codon:yes stop_codon:yes gene_type:complete